MQVGINRATFIQMFATCHFSLLVIDTLEGDWLINSLHFNKNNGVDHNDP